MYFATFPHGTFHTLYRFHAMPCPGRMRTQQLKDKLITYSKKRLKDINEILLDTDFYVSNTIQDNKRMKNDLAELTTTVREQKSEVAKIKTSVTKISKQCAVAKCDLEAAM